MKTQRRMLFSALVARIAKKFRSFPESKEKIVKNVRNETPNERMLKMDTNVETVVAPVVVDGPTEIRTRKGKKGPGSLVLVTPNIADAEIVKAEIGKDLAADTMVFTQPHIDEPIISAADWLKARETLVAAKAKKKAFIASLNPEQIALLPADFLKD